MLVALMCFIQQKTRGNFPGFCQVQLCLLLAALANQAQQADKQIDKIHIKI